MGDWSGPSDLTARGYLMWDPSYLYFACEVIDDALFPPSAGTGLWAGDAIQVAIDPLRDAGRYHTLSLEARLTTFSLEVYNRREMTIRVPLQHLQRRVYKVEIDDQRSVW